MNKEFWNERYGAQESAYGQAPNEYLKKKLATLEPGKILLPCDGEGRNAVHAASQGWNVSAFDMSDKGKERAELWAREKGVSINFQVGLLQDLEYPKDNFDALAMIYTHFPLEVKESFHRKMAELIAPGGFMIIEGFSKDHIQYREKDPKTGGPPNAEMLYDTEEIEAMLPNFEVIELEQLEVTLDEGLYHQGLSSVVRFLGRKK